MFFKFKKKKSHNFTKIPEPPKPSKLFIPQKKKRFKLPKLKFPNIHFPRIHFSKIFKKKMIIYLILIISILFLAFFFYYPEPCDNQLCFNNAVKECKPVKFLKVDDGDKTYFEIRRSLGDNCEIYIEKVSTEIQDFKRVEGKWMLCEIPKDKLVSTSFKKATSAIDFCSGPLKESLYEVIIDKMNNLIVKHIGEVMGELKKTIEEI